MSIAYLLGKSTSQALKTKINIPLLMVLSIIPDIDILYDFVTHSQIHRGPTHSAIFAAVIFIPFFIYYRKTALPYFFALVSHSLIGDFFIGGQIKLFWPVSSKLFGFHESGFYYINIFNPVNIALEIALFASAALILYKTRDWKYFLNGNTTNLILIIPITTVLLPSTIGYPFTESLLFSAPILALAHIGYLLLFTAATLKSLIRLHKPLLKKG